MDCHRWNQDVSEYSYQKNRSKLSYSNIFCSGIINLLFNGLAYNTSGHFAHCSYFSSPLRGLEKYCATRKISTRIICLNHRIRCMSHMRTSLIFLLVSVLQQMYVIKNPNPNHSISIKFRIWETKEDKM